MSGNAPAGFPSDAQRLGLSGYRFDRSLHLVLEVIDAGEARAFLAALLDGEFLTFGDKDGKRIGAEGAAVNIGFTRRGLEVLGVPDRYLKELKSEAPAFHEGPASRAARRLGDTGPSAVERWEPLFEARRAHVLISIHADRDVESLVGRLRTLPGAARGFEDWDRDKVEGAHLTGKEARTVHFGYRDNITDPKIVDSLPEPAKARHRRGELLLGYPNDQGVNRWNNDRTPPDAAWFFIDGSFAILRKISQDVPTFEAFVNDEARRLRRNQPHVTAQYLKAKLCGRWINGARVLPGAKEQPELPADPQLADALDPDFDFSDDLHGFGCPFGAHIRRTNPRSDAIAPPRLRPLFRRGMPYGPKVQPEEPRTERGLIGLFFCASIEDQFEQLMSEWVEKNPLGPRNRGNARDPLIGQHDEAATRFHVPQEGAAGFMVEGLRPFVKTRGTLYAFFPGRSALAEIARPSSQELSARYRPQSSPRRSTATGDDSKRTIEPDTAPPDRFCDIVMEGGITSGIIYASAVAELAKSYRFKSIGGSSIGAFAAALTAAAEFRRRKGSNEGFQALEQLPGRLAEEEDGKTILQRLFVPQDSTRRLFEIFLASLGNQTMSSRLFGVLREALRQYRRGAWIAVVAATVVVMAGPLALTLLSLPAPLSLAHVASLVGLTSWSLALGIAITSSVVVALLCGLVHDIRRGLVPNNFGLCRGWSESNSTELDVTGYLHESIQAVAGLSPIDDAPLTFGDLWNAPGAPSGALGYHEKEEHSIDLVVYATNLAHGRPYRFPDENDGMSRLFFRADELAAFFPKPILNHLLAASRPYEPMSSSDPDASPKTTGYRELPKADLPVVVAARLGMSFPLLISAVPLWAIDYEPKRGERHLAKCWMSDGGLCSNFPIHLFDSFLPRWPTFGISLSTRGIYRPEQRVWLPQRHFEGRGDTWHRRMTERDFPAGRKHSPLARLLAFLLAIWRSTWAWNDMTMMRMPGVRDRVVRLMLEKGQGGINIKMSRCDIEKLASDYGKAAAQAFVDKFAQPGTPGWDEHRWVRFNCLLVALRPRIERFSLAANLDRHTLPMDDQIARARYENPLRGPSNDDASPSEEALTEPQATELVHLLGALRALEAAFEEAGKHEPYVAVPRPSLRVRHPT